MGLPKVQHPTFELTIPSSKEKLRYRPFLVKEEKILLLGQQAGDTNEIMVAVKQIINNCIIEGNVDMDTMPSFDMEYIFLMLRANSVSDIAKINFTDEETKKKVEVEIDLTKIEVEFPDGHETKVKVNDELMLEMKYPTYRDVLEITQETGIESTFSMIKKCVDKVYSGPELDKVDSLNDYSQDEINEFVESFSNEVFDKIQKFFYTIPRLSHTVEYQVGKKTKSHTFLGLNDFFS